MINMDESCRAREILETLRELREELSCHCIEISSQSVDGQEEEPFQSPQKISKTMEIDSPPNNLSATKSSFRARNILKDLKERKALLKSTLNEFSCTKTSRNCTTDGRQSQSDEKLPCELGSPTFVGDIKQEPDIQDSHTVQEEDPLWCQNCWSCPNNLSDEEKCPIGKWCI